MADEKTGGQPDTDAQEEKTGGDDQQLTNAQIKSTPWVRELTKEVSELRAERAEREAAEKKAAAEKEAKELESRQNYEEAARKRAESAVAEALEKKEAEHQKTLAKKDAETELARLGFTNKRFVTGAISEFDPASQSAEEFAQSILDDPENASFLATGGDGGGGDKKHDVDSSGTPRGNRAKSKFSPDKLREWSKSDDKDKREMARQYKADYWDRHGTLPPD